MLFAFAFLLCSYGRNKRNKLGPIKKARVAQPIVALPPACVVVGADILRFYRRVFGLEHFAHHRPTASLALPAHL